jgi:hypothetical protein
MRFLLEPGDRVRFAAPGGRLFPGDILVFIQDKGLNVHRLLWTRKSKGRRLLLTKGDASLTLDDPVEDSAVIGKVAAYRREDGPWIPLDSPAGRARHILIGLGSTVYFLLFARAVDKIRSWARIASALASDARARLARYLERASKGPLGRGALKCALKLKGEAPALLRLTPGAVRGPVTVSGRLEALGESGREVVFDGAGVVLLGGAEAVLRHAVFKNIRGPAVLCSGLSRAEIEDCAFEACSRGVECSDFSRARLIRCSLSGCESALFAKDDSLLSCEGCSLERNSIGVEALGLSRCVLEGLSLRRNGTGLWAQDRSQVEIARGTWTENEIGARSSRRSEISLDSTALAGHRKAGVFLEDRGRARARECLLAGNGSGVIALHASRWKSVRCRFTGTRDTALWLDHRCRASSRGDFFSGNLKDRHEEPRPSYPDPVE